MDWIVLFIVIALICAILYFDRKRGRKPKNVDGFTGKVVETFPEGLCKVIISTDEGVVTIMAHNEINVSDGEFVVITQDKEKIYVSKRTGFWNI